MYMKQPELSVFRFCGKKMVEERTNTKTGNASQNQKGH